MVTPDLTAIIQDASNISIKMLKFSLYIKMVFFDCFHKAEHCFSGLCCKSLLCCIEFSIIVQNQSQVSKCINNFNIIIIKRPFSVSYMRHALLKTTIFVFNVLTVSPIVEYCRAVSLEVFVNFLGTRLEARYHLHTLTETRLFHLYVMKDNNCRTLSHFPDHSQITRI